MCVGGWVGVCMGGLYGQYFGFYKYCCYYYNKLLSTVMRQKGKSRFILRFFAAEDVSGLH